MQAYPTIVFVRADAVFPDLGPSVESSQREEIRIANKLIFSHDQEINRLRRRLSAE